MNAGDRWIRVKLGSRLLYTQKLNNYERIAFDKAKRTLFRVLTIDGQDKADPLCVMDDYPKGAILLIVERLA